MKFIPDVLKQIPRDLLEKHCICPLPSPNAAKTGVVQVFCFWDPNDASRRASAQVMLRPYLGDLNLEFFQPVVPSPDEYFRELLDATYNTKTDSGLPAPN